MNELLLLLSLLVLYSGVLLFYRLFGRTGLYCWIAIATIAANIEVMLLVRAFGMDQTLGNVLFASTFLVTDILSETAGKAAARKAVRIGIASALVFLVVSQSWLLYAPAPDDRMMPAMRAVFSNTPRILVAGFVTYAIVQFFDVWLYHRLWDATTRRFGNAKKFLWLRNNCATLAAQLLNTVLFTLGAFWGEYEWPVLLSIMLSTYAVFIVTSLADTPFLYLARAHRRDAARKGVPS